MAFFITNGLNANGLGLGEGGVKKVRKFKFNTKANGTTNVQPGTKAPLLPNLCCGFVLISA